MPTDKTIVSGEFRLFCRFDRLINPAVIILVIGAVVPCVFTGKPAFLLILLMTVPLMILSRGGVCRFEADESEFRIYQQRRDAVVLYYRDVVDVDFRPITTLDPPRKYEYRDRLQEPFIKSIGYDVTIKTKYREYKYRYRFGKNYQPVSHTPLFLLVERSGLDGQSRKYM